MWIRSCYFTLYPQETDKFMEKKSEPLGATSIATILIHRPIKTLVKVAHMYIQFTESHESVVASQNT